jgi:hypothetical protein
MLFVVMILTPIVMNAYQLVVVDIFLRYKEKYNQRLPAEDCLESASPRRLVEQSVEWNARISCDFLKKYKSKFTQNLVAGVFHHPAECQSSGGINHLLSREARHLACTSSGPVPAFCR